MAQSWVSRIGASPLWRAGLASAFILGLAGFAAGVVPQACRNGFVICTADGPAIEALAPVEAPAVDTTPTPPAPAPTEVTASTDIAPLEPTDDSVTAAQAIETAMVDREPASITQNDLIAQTFAALDFGLTTPTGELTARKVRTVGVGPDGMPIVEGGSKETQVAEASSEEPMDGAEPEPAPVQVAEAEVPEPVVSAEEPAADEELSEEPTRAVAYAPVRGSAAIVGGRGGNVRSLPKTKGSDVLFALVAGSEVTIVETQKGWAKIVDDRGRSGWIWDELLTR